MDDLEALRVLKYRYLRALDTKAWDEFAGCFVPTATADYGGLAFADRDQIVGYMREHVGDGVVTVHQAHHPELAVDGDRATGRWYLQDKVIVAAAGFMLEGAAFYEDRYVCTEAGWRIAHTGYRRTYEVTYDLADLPGFRISAPVAEPVTSPGRSTPSAPPRRPGPG